MPEDKNDVTTAMQAREYYNVYRRYFKQPGSKRLILAHVHIADAQAHCNNPETSSSTCKSSGCKLRTKHMGPWFDSYEKE